MKLKPKPLHLQNLANTLSKMVPSDLLRTQFIIGGKPSFKIAGEDGRIFKVVSSGWKAPGGGNGNGWGEALSGFDSSEIEFDLEVTDLHWSVRAFYRDGKFVGLQYEAEPWEREFIVPGTASYQGGFYTLGESFYRKIGGLKDDAINSLYCSEPPDWWVEMHPDAL